VITESSPSAPSEQELDAALAGACNDLRAIARMSSLPRTKARCKQKADALDWLRSRLPVLLAAERDAEPVKYDQTPSGCWAACVAGLTGLPHDQLAAFVPRTDDGCFDGSMGTEYHNAVNTYLRFHGWRLERLGADVPSGFAIGSGLSSRGVAHAVIVLDGRLWHDPHESREGIAEFTQFERVVRLATPAGDAWESLQSVSPACYEYATSRLIDIDLSSVSSSGSVPNG